MSICTCGPEKFPSTGTGSNEKDMLSRGKIYGDCWMKNQLKNRSEGQVEVDRIFSKKTEGGC